MSNDEMPPLACGQVWAHGRFVVLLGQMRADVKIRDRFVCEVKDGFSTVMATSDEVYQDSLEFTRARLIHGPGAPWSPAEEVPHS